LQEHQLQIAAAEAANSHKTANGFQRRLRELEEQVQADDRVERLEISLKNTQDRADELEFQLVKVKQVFTPSFFYATYAFNALVVCIRKARAGRSGV
jgi:hypothetical protein